MPSDAIDVVEATNGDGNASAVFDANVADESDDATLLDDAWLASDARDAGTDAVPDAGFATYQNLVLDESGDPFCARFGNTYYLYLPDQVRRDGNTVGGRVLGFTSTDLVHWRSIGAVFDNVDETRDGQRSIGLWAPEALEYGGHYYLYYVTLMSNPADPNVGDKDIEVVESDDPSNFRGGTRTVLLDDQYAFIDPDPFLDPVSGRLWLVFKRRGAFGTGSEIDVRPMDSPTSFSGARTMLIDSEMVPNTAHVTEQPTMWRAGDVYYLLFSANDGAGLEYHIPYATASSPTGPFTLRGTLFHSSSNLMGDVSTSVISPGSSSIVRDGAMQTWIVYRQKTTTLHTFADRGVAIDRVTFQPAMQSIAGSPSKGVTRRAPVPLM
jgi:beta-xylosidase